MWFDRHVFWILVLLGVETTTQEKIHRDVQRNYGMEEGPSGEGKGYIQPCLTRRSRECSIFLNGLCVECVLYITFVSKFPIK